MIGWENFDTVKPLDDCTAEFGDGRLARGGPEGGVAERQDKVRLDASDFVGESGKFRNKGRVEELPRPNRLR